MLRLAATTCLLSVLVVGCAQPTRRPTELSPIRKAELEHRALDLLKRAANSSNDLLAAHAMEALVDVAPETGQPIFHRQVNADERLIRFAAYVSLGRIQDCAARDLFDAGIEDINHRVRLAAAFAALRCGGDEDRYAPILAHTLRHHPDPNLRADAAYLIGLLGEERAKRRLEIVVRRDRNAKVATHAVAALAMLGDDEAFRQLINYTQGHEVARFIALQTLYELKDPRAEEALQNRLGPAEDYVLLRLVAARALGELGSDAGFDLALRLADPAIPIKEDVDSNERMKLRTNAALALGAIGDARALPVLEALAQADDPRVQVAACYALLKITKREPLRFTRQALRSDRGSPGMAR
jgi:HEAT repeat protein